MEQITNGQFFNLIFYRLIQGFLLFTLVGETNVFFACVVLISNLLNFYLLMKLQCSGYTAF